MVENSVNEHTIFFLHFRSCFPFGYQFPNPPKRFRFLLFVSAPTADNTCFRAKSARKNPSEIVNVTLRAEPLLFPFAFNFYLYAP